MKYDGLIWWDWMWRELINTELTSGAHTITIAYCEDGAQLDKINISDFLYEPAGKGEVAVNICEPNITPSGLDADNTFQGYVLDQNHPNPLSETTSISFEIPDETYVSLKVFNMLGVEVAELTGKHYTSGQHTIQFDAGTLSEGNYFYTLKTDKYSATRKMIVLAE